MPGGGAGSAIRVIARALVRCRGNGQAGSVGAINRSKDLVDKAQPWAPAIPQVSDEVSVTGNPPAERSGRLSTARKVRSNPREKVVMGQHAVNSKRTIPLTARGLFPRDYYVGIGDSADATGVKFRGLRRIPIARG